VQVRRKPLDDEQIASMIELYESGLSIRQVAAKIGVPKATVQNALARASVKMRLGVRQRHS
jgi:DNA-directed RNA polymerase specialized sigma24 family protein